MRITKKVFSKSDLPKVVEGTKREGDKRDALLLTQHIFYFLYSRVSFLRFAGDRLQLLPNKSGDGRLAACALSRLLGMLLM